MTQGTWLWALEVSDVSRRILDRWARIPMDPDRASRIWRGLMRKGVSPGCVSGLAAAVRRYLLHCGRWREVFQTDRTRCSR